jgi:hypothetical protein
VRSLFQKNKEEEKSKNKTERTFQREKMRVLTSQTMEKGNGKAKPSMRKTVKVRIGMHVGAAPSLGAQVEILVLIRV